MHKCTRQLGQYAKFLLYLRDLSSDTQLCNPQYELSFTCGTGKCSYPLLNLTVLRVAPSANALSSILIVVFTGMHETVVFDVSVSVIVVGRLLVALLLVTICSELFKVKALIIVDCIEVLLLLLLDGRPTVGTKDTTGITFQYCCGEIHANATLL